MTSSTAHWHAVGSLLIIERLVVDCKCKARDKCFLDICCALTHVVLWEIEIKKLSTTDGRDSGRDTASIYYAIREIYGIHLNLHELTQLIFTKFPPL